MKFNKDKIPVFVRVLIFTLIVISFIGCLIEAIRFLTGSNEYIEKTISYSLIFSMFIMLKVIPDEKIYWWFGVKTKGDRK